MEYEDKIILFPKEKLNSPPQSLEDTFAKIFRNRVMYSNEFCGEIMNVISSIFMTDNIDIEDDIYYNDLEMIKASIQSLHLKAHGTGHDFQALAEELFGEESEDIEKLLEEE